MIGFHLDRYPVLPYVSLGFAGIACIFGIAALKNTCTSALLLGSPRRSVKDAPSSLPSRDLDNIPYPPDALPGGRDVTTPYGTVRAFEWGPEHGRRVLLVHGVATPCIALGPLAERLAEQGCRVMLFDLYGRGYSENPPPSVRHDAQLYMIQIMCVLSSSPISWFTPPGFDLIGYSFGGGISASFNRYHQHLVHSLILIAPGGIIRSDHIGWEMKILYSTGILPESLLQFLVRRRVEPGIPQPGRGNVDVTSVAAESHSKGNSDATGGDSFDSAIISLKSTGKEVTISSVISWQLHSHPGFVPAFMSSMRSGPIYDQHETWKDLGVQLRNSNMNISRTDEKSKVLLILGESDPVIIKEEFTVDAKSLLEDQLYIEILEGGHELPIANSKDVAEAILRFWGQTIVEPDFGTDELVDKP